jgi:hypothetical protein
VIPGAGRALAALGGERAVRALLRMRGAHLSVESAVAVWVPALRRHLAEVHGLAD